MEELVKVVEKMSEKTMMDYLLVIIPIALSMVAIVISMLSAKRQNKIALFERRHACISQVKSILAFAETIKEDADPKIIVALFDAFWGTDVLNCPAGKRIINTKCQIEIIKREVEQAKFLFNQKFETLPVELLKPFHQVMMDSITNETVKSHIEEFCTKCDKFYKTELSKMTKKIRL